MNLFRVISKKIINFLGFNITRYNKVVDSKKYDWLRNFRINTIIDIGANIGSYSQFIHTIFQGATIYAFEPLKDCYDLLNKKKEIITNLNTFNIALGDRKETNYIYRSSFTPSSSILQMSEKHTKAFPHTKESVKQQIEIDTLDNVLNKVDLVNDILIKIDVQGFEKNVLIGAQNILKLAKIIIIELSFVELYQGMSKFDEIYDMLKDVGFKYFGSWGQLNDPTDGKPLQQDAIFIKE